MHRWVIKLVPLFERAFRKHKCPVGKSWRMDETYVKVRGQWKYLYRAVDKEGNTVDFLLRAHRDKAAARRYFERAIGQNGEPGTITVDKSGAIRKTKYLNNIVEQDHRAIKQTVDLAGSGEMTVDVDFLENRITSMTCGRPETY